MRIDPATLDPTSRLAHRITAALARDAASRSGTIGRARKTERAPAAREPQFTSQETWHDEEALQRAIVAMIAREARPEVIAFHVPNGGRRGKAEAGRLKAVGTRAGVPDLILLADGRAYGLELKTATGRQNAAQKAIAALFGRAGIPYEIARTVGEARAALAAWGLAARA